MTGLTKDGNTQAMADHPVCRQRRIPVSSVKVAIAVMVLVWGLLQGCALIGERAKMEAYGRMLDTYATAMRTSDFDTACQFVDPSSMSHHECLERFGAIKIVDYRVAGQQIATDRQQVTQQIEIGYYFLNHYLLKNIHFEQTWQYEEKPKTWLLHNGPPQFK